MVDIEEPDMKLVLQVEIQGIRYNGPLFSLLGKNQPKTLLMF